MKTILSLLIIFLCVATFAADTNSIARLVIVKAIYGDPNDTSATIDVTKQVAAAVLNFLKPQSK